MRVIGEASSVACIVSYLQFIILSFDEMIKAVVTALAFFHLVSAQDVPLKEDMSLYVYPEQMGNYSLGSCSSAPSCGTTMVRNLVLLILAVAF